MRIAVQAWAPEYGSELDVRAPFAPSEEDVDTTPEGRPWAAVPPADPAVVAVPEAVFVDGVRRTDARLFVTPDGEAAAFGGLASSIGVGSVVCSANGARMPARVEGTRIERFLAVSGGKEAALTAGSGLEYGALPVGVTTLEEVDRAIHERMRAAEAALAVDLASDGRIVFADGPLAKMSPGAKKVIGVIKSHGASYLPAPEEALVSRLECGERTPLFFFGAPQRPRYSWYLRLCKRDDALHGWHGIVRCEVPAAHSVATAATLADCSSALLPRFASEPHWDPRAPQNLVPIAGLERRLRHLLGDRDLAYRRIRAAARRISEGGTVA